MSTSLFHEIPRKVKNIPNDVSMVGPLEAIDERVLPLELIPNRHTTKVTNIRITENNWRKLSITYPNKLLLFMIVWC